MTKLKWALWGAAVLGVNAILLTGCEWSSGSSATTWNEAYNNVNFNGTYRGHNGGVLVTDYTATPGTPGSTNTVSGYHFATGNGTATTFADQLGHDGIMPGSVTVSTPGFTFTDDSSGLLAGTGGTDGTIDYGTGYLTLDFKGSAPDAGNTIVVAYQYMVAGNTGTGSAGPGSTGGAIFSFVVEHNGEQLTVTDNNGRQYKGKMGLPQGSMTTPVGSNGVATLTGPVIAQYNITGVSKAGLEVNMIGTLQGVAGGTGTTTGGSGSGTFADRRMFGTWIEKGGRTGDINGEASPIATNGTATNTTP